MAEVGADVVRVAVRVRKVVVGIGMQVERRVGPVSGEAGEDVEEARKELARLVATVGEDHERVAEAGPRLRPRAIGRRRERIEVDAVGDQVARDPAARGDLTAVPAHRDRDVDLVQQLDPARRQQAVRGLASIEK
jgi:hypothetical protein